jgi:hypothetical protein
MVDVDVRVHDACALAPIGLTRVPHSARAVASVLKAFPRADFLIIHGGT